MDFKSHGNDKTEEVRNKSQSLLDKRRKKFSTSKNEAEECKLGTLVDEENVVKSEVKTKAAAAAIQSAVATSAPNVIGACISPSKIDHLPLPGSGKVRPLFSGGLMPKLYLAKPDGFILPTLQVSTAPISHLERTLTPLSTLPRGLRENLRYKRHSS